MRKTEIGEIKEIGRSWKKKRSQESGVESVESYRDLLRLIETC